MYSFIYIYTLLYSFISFLNTSACIQTPCSSFQVNNRLDLSSLSCLAQEHHSSICCSKLIFPDPHLCQGFSLHYAQNVWGPNIILSRLLLFVATKCQQEKLFEIFYFMRKLFSEHLNLDFQVKTEKVCCFKWQFTHHLWVLISPSVLFRTFWVSVQISNCHLCAHWQLPASSHI